MNKEWNMYSHFDFQAQTDTSSGGSTSAATETPSATITIVSTGGNVEQVPIQNVGGSAIVTDSGQHP